MRTTWLLLVAVCVGAMFGSVVHGQNPSEAELKKKLDAYLRYMFAFGPEVKIAVGDLKPTGVPDLLESKIEVTIGEHKEDARVWVSKDGKFLLRGEMVDMTKDGFAENRAKLDVKGSPATGDPNAPITIVEFADFECPVCKQMHDGMRELLPKYPQARFVFKDFPLENIHPWARTAALAGQCGYQQDPKAFWKMYDLLYEDQDLISASNAWVKAVDYAGRLGLSTDAFKACMAAPESAAAVNASIANGRLLEVQSTPTLFVNGRRMVGVDSRQLEQLIEYELQQLKTKKN